MNSLPNNLRYNHSNHVKQYIWREKQLNIFYRSGRPIFNIDHNTMHIRSHNNPYFFSDPIIIQRTRTPIHPVDERKKNDYYITQLNLTN